MADSSTLSENEKSAAITVEAVKPSVQIQTSERKRYDLLMHRELAQGQAMFAKIVVPSMDSGLYDFRSPSVRPNTSSTTPSISDLEYIYWTNPVVHKAANLKVNRLIGPGFEILPSDHPDAVPGIAKETAERCRAFYEKIGGRRFLKQSALNAIVSGIEFTEVVKNSLKSVVYCVHGDFRTIDFRRNFISNKILQDSDGTPAGYWQYIENLAELYYSLSTYYGLIMPWKDIQAAKERLLESQNPNRYMELEWMGQGIGIITTKPNFMFIRKDEMTHLTFNTLNDNIRGVSMIIPAYNALQHLEQVMYASAEAINEVGYPKPVVYVGDKDNAPNENLNTLAATAIQDPKRHEGFTFPYYMKMEYLQPSGTLNINDFPTWFIKEVCIGLRIPYELLTGDGQANRANSTQGSTDFDLDNEMDRASVDQYMLNIFDLFLNSHGYLTAAGGRNIYLPKLKWPALVTEEEALRQKIVLERWEAGAITWEEMRRSLNLPVEEGCERNKKYVDEISKSSEPQMMPLGPTVQQGYAGSIENQTQNPVNSAQFRLNSAERLERLNREFKTEDVNYRTVAEKTVGRKIKSVDEVTAKQIRDAIVNMEAQGKSAKAIFEKVKELGDYTDEQAQMVLYTETHNLAQGAKLASAKLEGKKWKRWVAHKDDRTSPICAALHNQRVPIGHNFKVEFTEGGKTESWSGQAPSAHPHCRSHLEFEE